jgi:mono/diheme cytochrome c family protein
MIRHFNIWVTFLGLILLVLVIIFAGSLYGGSCSYHNNCMEGGRSRAAHTPIPTLIPATLQANGAGYAYSSSPDNCTATAETLLSAWVSAGSSETQPFQFTDSNAVPCQATFADVQPLFTDPNLWYPGALACSSCHSAELSTAASAQLDLSSYASVVAGSRRTSTSAKGVDILGGGNWQASRLNQVLFVLHQMPYGIPASAASAQGPTILAGFPLSVVNATPTPENAPPEIARPNTPGGPGDAVKLTGATTVGKQIYLDNCQMCHGADGKGNILNLGSDDGTVPPLNPIDPSIANTDYSAFAYNLDLFIQNGSRPAGPNPSRVMPPWGTQNGLTQQQIADVIAYIISLNK